MNASRRQSLASEDSHSQYSQRDGSVKVLICFDILKHESWFNTADIQASKAVLTSVGLVSVLEFSW